VFSDLCLSEPKRSGTKRKLTQRTLLQLNFTHAPSQTLDSTCQENFQFTEKEEHFQFNENDSAIVTTESSCLSSDSNSNSNSNHIDINHHDVIDDKNDIIDDKFDIFGVKFETLIVGRRYADKEEVCVGDTVSLLRDSQNVKDPNAIKVFVYFCFLVLLGKKCY
jgi:Fanconi-associated nuclease 1